jgi:riboflavin kinase/FMN adenylyltransferase
MKKLTKGQSPIIPNNIVENSNELSSRKVSTNKNKSTVLTIGNFDGLHKGHLKLINKVLLLAKQLGSAPLVCSFDANTKSVTNLIFPQNQLEEALATIGIDYFAKLRFTDEIKNLSCEEFVLKYLVEKFNCRAVVVGENFYFGKDKEGNADTLKELGNRYGFKVYIIKSKTTNKMPISSSYIRNLIESGKIEKANKLMFHNFSIKGIVKNGFKIGNSVLKIPTANIAIPKNCLKIKLGVYQTIIEIDSKIYKSITNVGFALISPKKEPLIETFIFDFSGDIYEKRINLTFLKYIRNERKFKSFKALKAQIDKDIAKVRGIM